MELDATLIELLLAAEIAGHYRSYQVLGAARPARHRATQQIIAALRHSMEQELERIFRLMALLSPGASLHDAYVGHAVREHAGAGQLRSSTSSTCLKPDLREVLLPLIDRQVSDSERAQLAERLVGPPLESPEQAVAVLLASDDPWLRSRAEIASQPSGRGRRGADDHTPHPPG